VKQTTTESLTGCARFLRAHQPSGAADIDFVTFGMATEYLRAFVDNEWTDQMVFGHPIVSRSNRKGREFMRAESTEADERFRNQQRTVRIAELLFNLQNVEGIGARLEDLRLGRVESTFAELEAGAFLWGERSRSDISIHPELRVPTMTLKSRFIKRSRSTAR
jgi:hypothetical protein